MKSGIAAALGFGAVVAFCAPAMGHHSGAMFDRSKKVSISGTVKEFQYTNPHSWLLLMVRDQGGKSTVWSFEAEGPSSLLRAGIKASTFAPGDKVTVIANPMKDGRPAGAMVSTTKADGKVYNPRPASTPKN